MNLKKATPIGIPEQNLPVTAHGNGNDNNNNNNHKRRTLDDDNDNDNDTDNDNQEEKKKKKNKNSTEFVDGLIDGLSIINLVMTFFIREELRMSNESLRMCQIMDRKSGCIDPTTACTYCLRFCRFVIDMDPAYYPDKQCDIIMTINPAYRSN